ncbi:MAG TPA: efflux transporter outer membrane subunit [Hyphomonadaceae bacterium]|nr:efflux transporter outer membrane subunit [Hyphomonadaceae bacterium]
MSKLSRAAAVSATAILSGCTMLGPNFQRPAAPAVSGYAMDGDKAPSNVTLSPDARAAGPWWTALGSAKLDELIRTSLKDSPDIAYVEANIRSALAEASAISGARSPQIDFSSNAQRQRINAQSFGFVGFPSPTINLYQIGFTGKYDFDIWGKKRRASEAAAARAEADQRRADAAYLTLSSNVALQAVRIAAIRAEMESITEIVDADNRVIGMIQKAQQAGGSPRSDTSLGETQLAQDLALLPPLERQLSEARHQLALLLGRTPGEWTAPDFALADFTIPKSIPIAIPSQLVHERPDILTAEAEFHAATADIGVATASLYPDISLAANLTQASVEPENLFKYGSSGWSIAAGIAGPIFHGHTLKEREKQAIAEADAKFADYRRTVLAAFVQVSDALSDVETSDRYVSAQDRAQKAANQNFEDARRSFDLGAGPLLNVFDAGRQLSIAQREKIRAQGQQLQDIIRLFAASASDWR